MMNSVGFSELYHPGSERIAAAGAIIRAGMLSRFWALPLLACALRAQGNAPDRGANFYSLEKERALGAQLAAEYRRSVTVIENAAVNAYLTDLGRRIAARSQGPDFTYTFELVDDNTLLNEAPAFPGGAIFVPAQLILAARSEDELAGMMAHSIAHIAARHGTKQATKGEISLDGDGSADHDGRLDRLCHPAGPGAGSPVGISPIPPRQ